MATSKKRSDPVMSQIFSTPGLPKTVAKTVGVNYQAVQQWPRVPPYHVLKLAPVLNMKPEQIRPDVFDPSKGKWVFKR